MYHKAIMKLTSALFLLTAAGTAVAQTSTPAKAPAKPAAAHAAGATHAAAKPSGAARASLCGADIPVLPASVPKVTGATPGCPSVLYALRFTDVKIGTGAPAVQRKWLTVNYTGYLVDGTKFDSSVGPDKDGKPREPITFPYGARQVIPGWDTGFEGMMVGGKRRMYVPYQLAYGDMGRPPVIPAKATLIFDVELVAISDNPPKPPTPPTPPPTPPPTQPAAAGAMPPADPAKPATVTPSADPTKPTAVPPPASTPGPATPPPATTTPKL